MSDAEEGKGEGRRATARWRLALAAALAVALLASPAWAPHVMRRLSFFRVRRVEILGTRYVSPAELLDRLKVDTTRSVWAPLDPLAARVRTHAQVESVTVTRRLPGTLGSADSLLEESHSDGLLEYPQYTRPPELEGLHVPDVLLRGNHAEIARWRHEEALKKTRRNRPDLLKDSQG